MITIYVLVCLITIFLTDFFIKKISPYMGEIFFDIPNSRSSHKNIKLKSGGLFFVAISLFSCFLQITIFGLNQLSIAIFICFLMSIVGLVDDLISLNSFTRYFFQLIISTLLIWITGSFINLSIIELFILIIFGTAIINITNFMDGIDGLITGSFLVLLIFYSISNFSFQILIVISSIFTFLKWNWEPSKIFMGDCGSNFIGSFIFYLILNNQSNLIDIKIMFILLPLFLDSGFCLLRRFLNKENIFQAHNKHLYQRLFQSGMSHSKISIIYISISILNSLFLFEINKHGIIFIILFQIIFGFYLERFVAVRFEKS
tara:strand:+ start:41 stop:988 length:948 start_codon:yes stop_codon:yes gene_type:complete